MVASKTNLFQTFLSDLFVQKGADAVVNQLSFLTGAIVITHNGVVIAADRKFTKLVGYSKKSLVGMTAFQLISADEIADMETRFARENTSHYSLKLLTRSKEIRHVLVAPLSFVAEGETYRVAEFVDITLLNNTLQQLTEEEIKFRAVFEQAAVGIARVSLQGDWLEVNSRLSDILGYSKKELLQLTFQDITYPEDLLPDLELVNEMLTGKRQRYSMEKRYFHKSGKVIWAYLTVSLIRDKSGIPQYFVSVIEDINYKKHVEYQLRYKASHDHLTGLLVRPIFTEQLTVELNRCRRYKRELSLIMLDIDNFKSVNDSHGHAVGDEVLKQFSRVLKDNVREIDCICRFGGEEFIILLPETSAESAQLFAERILGQIQKIRIKARRKNIRITASIGVVSYPRHYKSLRRLLTAADEAMYQAKSAGKNRVVTANS